MNEIEEFEIEMLHKPPKSFSRKSSRFSRIPRLIIGCPFGMEALYLSSTVYIKPYSGPHVIGNITPNNRFEVLNQEGKRIFMVTNHFTPKHELRLSNEPDVTGTRRKYYPVRMHVVNHLEDEVFQYYGVPGKVNCPQKMRISPINSSKFCIMQMIKVGPDGEPSWGTVTRIWSNMFHFSFSDYARFDIVVERDQPGVRFDNMETTYIVEGQKTRSCCPSASTKKMYFGTFVYGVYEASKEDLETATCIKENEEDGDGPLATVMSSLVCSKLAITMPGVEFPPGLNVFHKAVILGVLFVDIIRHW